MRISWWSNAPWTPTGYGVQTAQVCRRLHADGHTVAISANYGVHGQQFTWEGMPVYPAGMDGYSQDVIVSHFEDWSKRAPGEPAVLMSLFDVWVMRNERLKSLPLVVPWVPIDHLPCPPDVLDWCKRDNVLPIAMSLHGQRMLDKAHVAESLYVPHAVERWAKPTPLMMNGRDPRDVLNIPADAFVVMINAANKGVVPSRKGFAEMFQAFARFASTHRDAVLYLHTDTGPGSGGVDLMRLAAACDIRPEQLRAVDQYAYRMSIAQETLASLYTMADVLLSTSMGEGFGIPVLEAQACGTRVIVSDWTAQPELVGDGWAVDVQPWWDEPQRAWFCVPIVDDIVRALDEAHDTPRGHSVDAINFAARYDADVVWREHWRPALAVIEERLAA